MRRRKAIVFTNLPQRDLATDRILGEELQKRGLDVYLTNFLPKAREFVLFGKPDIVVGPECRCEYTVDFYKRCMEWGIKAVARRTEGGAAKEAWEAMDGAERGTTVGMWPYDVDLEIVWGEDMKELVAMNGHVPGKKITAVGAMPLDPYFRDEQHLHPKGRKNILVATGWGHADSSPVYNVPEAPPESPIHADAYNRHRQGREAYIELIRQLMLELQPEYTVVVRLKVGERPDEYLNRVPGVKIVQPCDTKIALLNSDYLVHAGSTMGLEAHLMDIPAFSYLGQLNQTVGYNYPCVSKEYDQISELIKAIKEAEPQSNAIVENFKKLEEEFYGTIDGKACSRAADAIAALSDTGVPTTPLVWPPEGIEYEFPGCSKQPNGWQCETCGRITYTNDPTMRMIKCLHCGISLCRRP